MKTITQPREVALCGDLFTSPPPLPFSPGLCFFPASCPKDTHHYGTNHRGFDHPPQSRVVIHIPAAARQTERREMMLGGIISPGWLEGMEGHHRLLPASPSCSSGRKESSPSFQLSGWKESSQAGCTPKPSPGSSCLGPSLCSPVKAGIGAQE